MLKHNKKKNAGIVYEQLISLITRLAANKQHNEAEFVMEVMKKYYNNKTALGKERKLFSIISESDKLSDKDAHSILTETLDEASKIDHNQLEKEKISLINEINFKLSTSLYDIPLKGYKSYASAQILFNEARQNYKYTTPKERTKLKNSLLKTLTEGRGDKKDDVKVDNFTYKVLVNKFNKKYSKLISEDQRAILKEWVIYLTSGNKDRLVSVLTEKTGKIKKALNKHINEEKHKDSDYGGMLKEAYSKVSSTTFDDVDEEKVYEVMKMFDVCEDLDLVIKEEFRDEQ